MLLSKGYPDIGWNPCGGEKYLDFLRFAVFVNGTQSHHALYDSIWTSSGDMHVGLASRLPAKKQVGLISLIQNLTVRHLGCIRGINIVTHVKR